MLRASVLAAVGSVPSTTFAEIADLVAVSIAISSGVSIDTSATTSDSTSTIAVYTRRRAAFAAASWRGCGTTASRCG